MSAGASLTLEEEKTIGQEFYENLERNKLLYHEPQAETYINELGKLIVKSIPQSPFEFRFFIVRSSAINAFATPGGYVYLNLGLINLVNNESELAGVLAHEVAHVTSRHIADIVEKSKKISAATLAAILTGIFLGGGDAAAAITGFSVATATTLNLKYSREHEEEADRLGMYYLVSAGFDPASMPEFLKTMRQYEFYSSNIPSYFLTHPGTEERIRYLDSLLQTRYPKGGASDKLNKLKRIQTLLAFELKSPEQNLKSFQGRLSKDPDDVEALYGLALAQEKLGLSQEAVDNFLRALRLSPDDKNILEDLGITLFKRGNLEEAIRYLNKAVALDPTSTKAPFYLGKSYETLGNYQKALEFYQLMEKSKPDDENVFYGLASAYGKIGMMGDSHYYFGRYFKKKGKSEAASFHFQEALKYLPPDSLKTKEIMKELQSEKGMKKEKKGTPR